MTRQAVVAVLGAVVVAAGVAFTLLRRDTGAAQGEPDPTDSRWVCAAPGCGKDFALTFAQLGAFYADHPGENPPCPACGKSETARATACPSCGRTVPKPGREHSSKSPPKCPHCGEPL
ncbi:MAG: hypothetical protein L6Q35_03325 [Phycisphaerales bacterium]|nr:hypothetical protein [Phycisphaerales bacterium]